MKSNIIIGLLGSTLDNRKDPDRWAWWRPTVSLCMHEDFLVRRFELLYEEKVEKLAQYVADDMRAVSPETEVRLHPVNYDDPWDFEEVYGELHDFARRYDFNTDAEDYLVHITTGTHVQQIILFLLTEARYFPGRLIQTSPPRRRQDQPTSGTFRIIDLDLSRYDRLASRFVQEQQEGLSFLKSGIDTRNDAFNRLIAEIEQVAVYSRAPILLLGPTGAGKSLLARKIYALKKSRRQVEGPLIEVNCATLRGEGAMSTLFGHVKGAFTGAMRDRPGQLLLAHRGILFLDEIGELGVDEQAMLLRAVEEQRFLPLGADREVESDFQLIAGTNRDLWAAVEEGRFREDLLARINLWTFRLPGLPQRREDIEPNLDYELREFARRNNAQVSFSKEARVRFLDFARSPAGEWRANFRDLNAAVTRMATMARGGRITEEIVEGEIRRLQQAWRFPEGASPQQQLLDEVLDETRLEAIDQFDRFQLEGVLQVCRASASLSEAGRKLFAISRQRKKNANDADRLRKYLAKFGLEWGAVKGEG
ncbi:MAG: RNA repair transcriptional activator RtcR [Calditrichaeota bacterium]|nr:RNA repair transcriptional activator RtcR [Calditrichota bacterium]